MSTHIRTQELNDFDLAAELERRGIAYTERTVTTVGTWYALAREIVYTRPQSGARLYNYVLDHRPVVDSWYETIYTFDAPVPDEGLAAVIDALRPPMETRGKDEL